MALIDELIAEQKMTRDPTQPPRHLTDAFLDPKTKLSPTPSLLYTTSKTSLSPT